MATMATLPNSLRSLPLFTGKGAGGNIDIFIDRDYILLPSLRRRSELDCLDRREPIKMQSIESHVCEPITNLSSSIGGGKGR
jgi:hypothetical protein